MVEETAPSIERGKAFRDAANMVRGMLLTGHYKPEEIPDFLSNYADANDILLTKEPTTTDREE